MIVREKGTKNIAFSCDKCSETFESDTNNFTDAWTDAKAAGWKAQKDDDEWLHRCPSCVEK